VNIEPKLKDRLLKLLALTESGNRFEAANAQSRIEALCKKHGVDVNVLTDACEDVVMHWFRYDNSYSQQVLGQTIFRLTNIVDTWTNKSRQRQTGVQCTASQAAEIELWWSVMRAALKQHLADSTHAFIQANRLFGDSAVLPERERTEEEIAAAERAMRLAKLIDPTQVLKRLE
jgi:hypothetical protein